MAETPGHDGVIAELETLRQTLDRSLSGLQGKLEHVPMHHVVGGLLHRVTEQQHEIQELRRQLAECLSSRA